MISHKGDLSLSNKRRNLHVHSITHMVTSLVTNGICVNRIYFPQFSHQFLNMVISIVTHNF